MLRENILLKLGVLFLFVSVCANAEESYQLNAQTTFITQGHSIFPSPYSGKNSLQSVEDAQTSQTLTLYSGLNLGKFGELYFNPELTGGMGLSQTEGVAGFPNAEIYRVSGAAPVWAIARFYLKKVFALSEDSDKGSQENIEAGLNQLPMDYAVDRLTLVLGKYALNDFFDNNSYSHDPRTQFLNWVLMDYGAWDYAADTRGYSWGLMMELNHKSWALRYSSVLEPQFANQMNLDLNVAQAHGDNLEYEYRYSYREQPGVLRVLIFNNHAFMGNYQSAVALNSVAPDVTATRQYSQKYGGGLNWEQAASADFGWHGRLSWNDGHTETWAFTEIDQSETVGFSWMPHFWSKLKDTVGCAIIVNDLSPWHRAYLASGGYGFIIGDGQLNYASEKILETYYLLQLNKSAAVTLDYQFVSAPGYNADRGPVSIFAVRIHGEI